MKHLFTLLKRLFKKNKQEKPVFAGHNGRPQLWFCSTKYSDELHIIYPDGTVEWFGQTETFVSSKWTTSNGSEDTQERALQSLIDFSLDSKLEFLGYL